MKKKVVAVGELLWDLFPDYSVAGGAPFNLACRISSMGDHGMMVSALGTDDRGKKLLELAEKTGVDLSLLQWDA